VCTTAELLHFESEAFHSQPRTVFVSALVIWAAPNVDVRYRFADIKWPATFWTKLLGLFVHGDCFRVLETVGNSEMLV
jgi:hypothetical protein